MLVRQLPLKQPDVGSIPTASTVDVGVDVCVRGVAATCYPPKMVSRVRFPPDALVSYVRP